MREQGELQGSSGLSVLLCSCWLPSSWLSWEIQLELWPPTSPELQEEGKCFGAYMQLDTNI